MKTLLIDNFDISYRLSSMDANELQAANLKRIRLQRGLTQEGLGELVDVRPHDISAYENNKKVFGKALIEKICNALNIKIGEFYFESDTSQELTVYSDPSMAELATMYQEMGDEEKRLTMVMARKFHEYSKLQADKLKNSVNS